MSQTTITDIGTVGIPVSDQDKALEFFTGTLGFEKRLDVYPAIASRTAGTTSVAQRARASSAGVSAGLR